ncbi:hypothetical protein CsatB_008615 [Cannabis sativa]
MARPLNPYATPFFTATQKLIPNYFYIPCRVFHPFYQPMFPLYLCPPLQPPPEQDKVFAVDATSNLHRFQNPPENDDRIRSPSCRRRRSRRSVWMRKDHPLSPPPTTTVMKPGGSDDKTPNYTIPFPDNIDELQRSDHTTVMIRNIPNRFSKYWNSKTNTNLGYGFVNFTSPEGAWSFFESFHKFSWSTSYDCNKVCEVTLAKIQGLDALREAFKSKNFYCNIVEYLPVMFVPARDGGTYSGRAFNLGRTVEARPRHPINRSTQSPLPGEGY